MLLDAVATLGAIALAIYDNGDYTEAIAVMLFYQIGELFQSYAVGKSRRNISDLMDIRPDYANIENNGTLEKVDPDEVEIGSVIVVQAGRKSSDRWHCPRRKLQLKYQRFNRGKSASRYQSRRCDHQWMYQHEWCSKKLRRQKNLMNPQLPKFWTL